MSGLSTTLVQGLQRGYPKESRSQASDTFGQSVNSSITLDVSQLREDLHGSESYADADIYSDVDIDIDSDHDSESADKENVRPVLQEVLLPRHNPNTDVECHIDAWLESAGEVLPLLAAKAAERASPDFRSHSPASTQRSQALLQLAQVIRDNVGELRDLRKGSFSSDPAGDAHDRMED